MTRAGWLERLFAGLMAMMVSAVAAAGCLGEESIDEVEVDDVSAEGEEVFTVTVVDLDQGGIVVNQYTETLSERQARESGVIDDEYAASRAAISEVTCVGGDLGAPMLRLYDQTSYGGNAICFNGTGVADLRDYNRYFALGQWFKWDGAVRSFKSGNTYSVQFGG